VRDEIIEYEQLGVKPFGVNPATPEQHAGYAERLKLPFVLLSDPGGKIAGQFHALAGWGTGITRTVYLVGRDGLIQYSQRGAPGSEQILESLR
jgi:thioredoxin-dependent peroxiredoxin